MVDEIMQVFKDAGAMQEGHFLLTSGLHSPVYWEKFRILQYPRHTAKLCALIAGHYKYKNVQVVAGPTTGGIIIAFEVARQLGVRGIFAEKEGNKRVFRRSLTINKGEHVLIVDDVITTGGSVREVIEAVQERNGDIIGIGVLVDRNEKGVNFGFPLYSCLKAATPAYRPDECPLCAAGVELTRPGGHS